MKRRELIALGAAALFKPLATRAQPIAGGSALHLVRQPYGIESWGEFRRMIMTGDFSPKVRLDDVMAKHPSTGVGAVSGARGEITIFDGKLIVSYGQEGAHPDPAIDSASLLVVGSAAVWQSVRIDRDLAPADIETYIGSAARAHGIDPRGSFPFQVRATLTSYIMHVNVSPTAGPHGMGLPMAMTMERRGERIDGNVAGLYVSADLMGIATHGGERMHAHWISPDGRSTAHLERWGLAAGATLMLSKA